MTGASRRQVPVTWSLTFFHTKVPIDNQRKEWHTVGRLRFARAVLPGPGAITARSATKGDSWFQCRSASPM